MSETNTTKKVDLVVKVVTCDRCGAVQELQTTAAELPQDFMRDRDRDAPLVTIGWRPSSTWGHPFRIDGRQQPIDLCPPCSIAFGTLVIEFLALGPGR